MTVSGWPWQGSQDDKEKGTMGKKNLLQRPARGWGLGGGAQCCHRGLGERWDFSVCSSWHGSIPLLCCPCSELPRPGLSLQRLCQPSQSARHVNTQQGSEKAALSLRVPFKLSENPQDSSPRTDIPLLMGKSPVSALQAVRLKLTHRRLQSRSPQGNESSHLPKPGNTLGSGATGWLVGLCHLLGSGALVIFRLFSAHS